VRTSTVVMIAFAIVFGLLAVFVSQSWLNSQAEQRVKSMAASQKPISTRTIVVAAKPLRFGNEVMAANLREVAWPEEALPSGSFAKISDVIHGGKRVALSAMDTNEPILSSKITGPGQRATLSTMLRDGLKAVTMRVNDVDGVGGFVLPGDHVDIGLTRQFDKTNATSEIVLQNIRVLAIDQVADERVDKPSVVRSVTVEVDAVGAQKLTLSASVGHLSLMLRKAGEADNERARRVTLSDLGAPSTAVARDTKNQPGVVTVSVRRASARQEYSVPAEGADLRAAVDGDDSLVR
jgi:pilus assembly protein CpaB